MATSGTLTTWVQELTGGAQLRRSSWPRPRATPPGADGLVVLPYFAGERTPIFDPHARGVVAGLTLRHGRGHVFRAVYEGIAYGIRQILEVSRGRPPGRPPPRGGRRRDAGRPVDAGRHRRHGARAGPPAETIGASYGDALLAAIGTGAAPPETDWSRVAQRLVPDPGLRGLYDELYATYRDLYPATRDRSTASPPSRT